MLVVEGGQRLRGLQNSQKGAGASIGNK